MFQEFANLIQRVKNEGEDIERECGETKIAKINFVIRTVFCCCCYRVKNKFEIPLLNQHPDTVHTAESEV